MTCILRAPDAYPRKKIIFFSINGWTSVNVYSLQQQPQAWHSLNNRASDPSLKAGRAPVISRTLQPLGIIIHTHMKKHHCTTNGHLAWSILFYYNFFFKYNFKIKNYFTEWQFFRSKKHLTLRNHIFPCYFSKRNLKTTKVTHSILVILVALFNFRTFHHIIDIPYGRRCG